MTKNTEAVVARVLASLPPPRHMDWSALDDGMRAHLFERWEELSAKEKAALIRWMENIEAQPASDKVRQQLWDEMRAPRRFCLSKDDMDRFDASIEAWGASWQAALVADLTKAKLPASLAGPIANATGVLGCGNPREAFEEWDEAGHVSFYGDWSDELRAMPNRISCSSDAKSYKWPVSRKVTTWGAAIGALILSAECKEKGQEGICQGEVKDGGQRLADKMLALYGIFIDIESGDREADVRAKLIELGIAGVTYSTFSHNKPETKITNKALMDYLKVQTLANLTDDDVRRYLIERKGMRPWVVENITVEPVEGEHAKLVKHAVIERFRVVIPLAEAFRIVEHGESEKQAGEIWAAFYRGVARMLDVWHDQSCEDLSRFVWLPEHPIGRKDYFVNVIGGRALRFDEVTPVDKPKPNPKGNAGKKVFELPWLPAWYAKWGKRFLAADFFEHAMGGVRRQVSGGKVETVCPFDHEHTESGNPEDKAFFATNFDEAEPGEDGEQRGYARCSHGHGTNGKHTTLDYIQAACARVGITDWRDLENFVALTTEDGPYNLDEFVEPFADLNAARLAAEAIVDRAKSGEKAGIHRAVEILAERLGLTPGVSDGDALEIRDMLCGGGRKPHVVGTPRKLFWDEYKRGKEKREKADRENGRGGDELVDWLPEDFSEVGGWITYQLSDTVTVKVCKMFSKPPVQVRDPEGSGWALEIAFRNNDGVEKTLIASGRRVQNDKPGLRGDFQSAGLGFGDAQGKHDVFASLLTALLADEKLPKIREMNRAGWDKSFSTWTSSMGEIVGGAEGEVYRLSTAGGVDDHTKNGTLEGEKDVLAAAWELDSAYRRFSTLLPFQGPVGQLARLMGGGFWVWGVEGTGKSDGARTAVMPHSNPMKGGNFRRLDATENSLEATFIQGTGCVVVLDETKGKKAQAAAVAAAMKVESGSESGRMAYKQSADQVQNKATVNFHVTNLLITSERSMEAIFAEEKRALVPGEVIRICPLKLPPKSEGRLPPDHPLLKRLDGWKDNHGWAAPVFVAKLIEAGWNTKEKRAELTDAINELAIKLVGEWLDGVRAARKFAAAWWAGEFAREHGLIPADADVEACVRVTWQMFLDSPESKRLRGGEHALERVRAYVAGNMRRTILPAEAANSTDWQSQVADGWFTDTHIFLLRDRLVAMVNNEFQLDVVLKGLEPVCERRKHEGRATKIVHEYVPVVGWSNTPHVRIDRKAFGLAAGGGEDETGGVTEELDLEGLQEKADQLAARLRHFNWPVPELAIGATTTEGQKMFLQMRVEMLELACDRLDKRVKAGAK